jgi:ubiquinone/menaquinone biosynthesis C-methylase UbiE
MGTASVNGELWGARARDWANIQEGQVRPAYEAVFGRLGLGRGKKLLDVGCGAGMAASIAAASGVSVSGIDASDALIAIARERVPSGDFRVGEIEELPFDAESFDAVTGFNSFQYASSPASALAAAKRVARKGAPVVVLTWGKPEGMPAAALVAALRPLMPPPPPGAPGPFALSEENALRALVTQAGLAPEVVVDVESPWEYPDLATAVRGLNSAGVAERAMRNTSEDAVTKAHSDALAPFRGPDGRYRIGAAFRFIVARA